MLPEESNVIDTLIIIAPRLALAIKNEYKYHLLRNQIDFLFKFKKCLVSLLCYLNGSEHMQ